MAVSFYEMHKMYPPFGYYAGDLKSSWQLSVVKKVRIAGFYIKVIIEHMPMTFKSLSLMYGRWDAVLISLVLIYQRFHCQ